MSSASKIISADPASSSYVIPECYYEAAFVSRVYIYTCRPRRKQYIKTPQPVHLPVPRLALATVLNARPGCLVWLGQKCSSFCGVNRGTSGRSIVCGLGNLMHGSVKDANMMMARPLDLQICTVLQTSEHHVKGPVM